MFTQIFQSLEMNNVLPQKGFEIFAGSAHGMLQELENVPAAQRAALCS